MKSSTLLGIAKHGVHISLKGKNAECKAESKLARIGPEIAYSMKVNLRDSSGQTLPEEDEPCHGIKGSPIEAGLNLFTQNVVNLIKVDEEQTKGWPALRRVTRSEFPDLLKFLDEVKPEYLGMIQGR